MKEKVVKGEEVEVKDARIYEFGYVLVPTIDLDALAGEVSRLKKVIESKGGVFISEEAPHLIGLAYEMSRIVSNKKTWFDQGYFGWMKFEIDPAHAEEIDATFRLDEKIVRYLVIKTVRENTMSTKRMSRPDVRRGAKDLNKDDVGTDSDIFSTKSEGTVEKVKEDKGPMDTEEVDREIEKMVLPE